MLEMKPNYRTLISGLSFPESPRWHRGHVYCVDGPNIMRSPLDGPAEVFVALPTFMVLGLTFMPDGDLLAVAGLDRMIYRITPMGDASVFADLSDITSSPLNEIIAAPDGGYFIGGMGFDPAHGEAPRASRMIYLDPQGHAAFTGPDVIFPNGLGWLSPGQFVVAESFAARVSTISYLGQGKLGDRRTLVDVARENGHPDGLCVNAHGEIWYADAYRGLVILVGVDGKIIRQINLPVRHAIACCLGEKERQLYVAGTDIMPGPGQDNVGKGVLLAFDL